VDPVLAFSEIIDFLLKLMRDENARAEFEQDPQGTLARAGLEGVTGQDISDARLQLADSGAVRATGDDETHAGRSSSDEDHTDRADPVLQINHTTQHYEAEDSGPADHGEDASSPTLSEANSFFFQTFNSDDDVTIIDDSFNAVDNSSTDVTLTNIDATNSFNEGSFTSDDDVTTIDAENSFNSSDDDNVVAIRDDDTIINDNDVVLDNSFNQTEAPDAGLAAVSPPSQLPSPEPAADEPAPDEPAAAEPLADEPVEAADEIPIDDAPLTDEPIDEAVEDPIDDPVDDPVDDPADIVSA
jgi:hypothetical protein